MKTTFIVKAHWEEVNTESEFCVYKNQPYMHFTENDFYVFQFPSLKAQRNFFKEGFRKIENDVEGDAKRGESVTGDHSSRFKGYLSAKVGDLS